MPLERILVADDEELIRRLLKTALSEKGIDVHAVENGEEALKCLETGNFDLLITDMRMDKMSGIELLKKARVKYPDLLVAVMTAFGTIENAVEAMQIGAFHYLLKPFTIDALDALITRAKSQLSLTYENALYREESAALCRSQIIAESLPMKALLKEVLKVSKTNATILLSGETGTGKEIIAHYIHENSERKQAPLVKVNSAAIPETLLESEFFGHEKGAFTGAHMKRIGRFELADKGTLFLDEVTEIPIGLQPKLLRAIQEREFERVGGTKTLSVDVRLIAATNRDPKTAVKEKILREDLYFRLSVIPIFLPPLRDRSEDIIPLALHFLDRFSTQYRKKGKKLTAEAERQLKCYPWPGNVRELANVIERSLVLSEGTSISPDELFLETKDKSLE